jgi:hypothetical protein
MEVGVCEVRGQINADHLRGDYGASADSGGLGFGREFDNGAKDIFDFTVGALAGASGTILGL